MQVFYKKELNGRFVTRKSFCHDPPTGGYMPKSNLFHVFSQDYIQR
jgi:hypothetical protein